MPLKVATINLNILICGAILMKIIRTFKIEKEAYKSLKKKCLEIDTTVSIYLEKLIQQDLRNGIQKI